MIIMHDVGKKYMDFQLHMSMEIPEGRITGLVGKNGAGKSTAIRLLLGLARQDSGSIKILGKDTEKMTPYDKQKLGVSLAESGFSGQFDLGDVEHILSKMYTEFDREFFRRKCQELKISPKKRIRTFSTGMKAKLKVLTAISHNAKLLILDEPTAGLDVEAWNEILDMLRNYLVNDEERTILITSHIASDLETLCDDIYLIHDGRIIVHEETDTLMEEYGILKVSNGQYEALDKEYLIKSQKVNYGYACFTANKKFYQENYPGIVVENGGIDELILMMTGGYQS